MATGAGKLLETGIKVIDVMCPLVAGGSVVIAGEYRVGTSVVTEELVRRLSGGTDRVSLFSLGAAIVRPAAGDGSFAAELKKERAIARARWVRCRPSSSVPKAGHGHRTPGGWRRPTWSFISRASASRAKVYPAVDVLDLALAPVWRRKAVSDEHVATAERVRQALTALWADRGRSQSAPVDGWMLERALKLQNYFTQPFYIAEPYTKLPGATVSLPPRPLQTCPDILTRRPLRALPVDAST